MTSGGADDPGVAWLVAQAGLAVRALVSADLHAEESGAPEAPASSVVGGLLAGLTDAGATRRPYAKWGGAHWRLISLVELGLAPGRHAAVDAADMVLSYWADAQRLAAVPVVESRARRCTSQEGNAVAVACRLGLADDDRVGTLVEHLIAWQWPYWHYDVLQALLVLHRAGFGSDPRTERAREMVRRQRRPDGTWRPGRAWWRRPGSRGGNVEVVDWGDVAHQMVTLNALRVGARA